MRFLVVGGNGFVGRPLVDRLCQDHTVSVLDNLRSGCWRFAAAPSNPKLIEADVTETETVSKILRFEKPDVVINLSAIHFVPECESNPILAMQTNVGGTINLLLATPHRTRFVYLSSAAVYAPDDVPHVENRSVMAPTDVYGWTKLHGEDWTRYYAEKNNFSAVVVRLFNVIGSGETNPHILPEIIAQLRSGARRLKLGNVTPKRDYVFVDDVVTGLVKLATEPVTSDGKCVVVNLGTGHQHAVTDLVNRLSVIIGERIEIEVVSDRVRTRDRPNLLADTTRLTELVGWRPQVALEDALHQIWADPQLPTQLETRYASEMWA